MKLSDELQQRREWLVEHGCACRAPKLSERAASLRAWTVLATLLDWPEAYDVAISLAMSGEAIGR